MIIVRENTVRFVENLGKFRRVLKPGLNFFIPGIERVTAAVSLREQISKVEHQKVITKDNVEIDVDGNFFYKVNDPQKAFYNALDFVSAIEGLSTSVSRSEIGKMTLDQIFQNRKELNDLIKQNINESTTSWGLECLSYEILRIDPPVRIKEALREVAVAERLRRKEIIVSEADREFNEKVSQARRDALIIVERAQAEGQRMVSQRLGDALAELNAVLEGSAHRRAIVDFLVLEAHLERLKEIIKANKVFLFPPGQLAGGESLLMLSQALKGVDARGDVKEDDVRKLFGALGQTQGEHKGKDVDESGHKTSKEHRQEEELQERINSAQTKVVNIAEN